MSGQAQEAAAKQIGYTADFINNAGGKSFADASDATSRGWELEVQLNPTRYWTMKGHRVPRRFGWDCHGVPVEYEINKTYKIESSKQVLEMGIDKYNAACRSIVQRYSQEWKRTVRRVGRWVDMENAYFTMDVDFMQSVWWVFQELYKKGLIYEGHKVVPYSVGISTPLSNFEANQNYKQVQDPAITISFPILGRTGESFLAWTTTPWTLPSNLALAVGKDIDYVRVREKSSGHVYILAAALAKGAWKNPENEIEVLETVKGEKLIGLKYEPLFSYFADKAAQGAFRVIASDHVTTESGTGIVHMAPAFGEEDYYACQKEGVPMVNPVDNDGMFTAAVPDYAGRRMKDADKDDAILVAVTRNGEIFLSPGNARLNVEDLPGRVRDLLTNRLDKTVYIKSDSRAKYERVMDAIDNLRAAGVDQLGLLTEQIPQEGGKK